MRDVMTQFAIQMAAAAIWGLVFIIIILALLIAVSCLLDIFLKHMRGLAPPVPTPPVRESANSTYEYRPSHPRD